MGIVKPGFRPVTMFDGSRDSWKWLPCEAITPKIGMGLALDETSGQLEVSTTPQYICMAEYAAAVAAGTLVPVVTIDAKQLWEVELDGTTAFKVGQKCDVAAGGMKLDADGAVNGNFLIEYMAGTASGDAVRGRFVG